MAVALLVMAAFVLGIVVGLTIAASVVLRLKADHRGRFSDRP